MIHNKFVVLWRSGRQRTSRKSVTFVYSSEGLNHGTVSKYDIATKY
jgi:hypothetical protein